MSKQKNGGIDTTSHRMVVEFMWMASVGEPDLFVAVQRRRMVLEMMLLLLERSKGLILHHNIDGVLFFCECKIGIANLPSELMDDLFRALNKWDESSQSYARRGNLTSLIRILLHPQSATTVDSKSSEQVSDMACQGEGKAHHEDKTRSMRHEQKVQKDLPIILEALSIDDIARMPNATSSNHESDVRGSLSGGSSSSASSTSSILALFRRRRYDALRQMDAELVIRALSYDVEALRSLLVVPSEDGAPIKLRQGNTRDFSGDKKPPAKP